MAFIENRGSCHVASMTIWHWSGIVVPETAAVFPSTESLEAIRSSPRQGGGGVDRDVKAAACLAAMTLANQGCLLLVTSHPWPAPPPLSCTAGRAGVLWDVYKRRACSSLFKSWCRLVRSSAAAQLIHSSSTAHLSVKANKWLRSVKVWKSLSSGIGKTHAIHLFIWHFCPKQYAAEDQAVPQ